ncbi:MAG: hypothetical protein AB1641_16795 [Thermodesulfobacteriota bacterium]
MLFILAALVLIHLFRPFAALPAQAAEVWESDYLWADIIAHVEKDQDRISGVVYVIGLFGKKDVYHFTGTIRQGLVTAAHYSGHRFQGALKSEDEVEGVVTSRGGYVFKVNARRRAD